jgi:short-subunit dehydrogenase
MMDQRAIIIGATSGIGRALAMVLSREKYIVGICGRRIPLLEELKKNLPSPSYIKPLDLRETVQAMQKLEELITEMGGMDLIVISSGVGTINPDLQWSPEKETIDVNVTGFTAMVNVAIRHFIKTGRGHLVGISSIAALRGSGAAPAYNASKAFESNYLQGLRQKMTKQNLPITITDIQPGFVDTAMAKGDNKFWVASPETAAEQIYHAIRKKKNHAYITRRWRLIAWLFKSLPDFIYNKL